MFFVNNAVYKEDTAFWINYYSIHQKSNTEISEIEKKIIEKAVYYSHIMLTKYEHLLKYALKDKESEMLKQFNAKLECSDLTYIPRYAEYIQNKRIIVLYTQNIYKDAQQFSLSVKEFKLVCLMHEFFHLLEDIEGDTTKIIIEYIGISSRKAKKLFSLASEIAAHTFAKNICALDSIIL